MKKIVALSVYGDKPRYIVGAKRQYELAKKFYPDWEFRLFTDNPSNFIDLSDANIIHITAKAHGMFWRFLPMYESDDNVTIIRDADSRITVREQMAIQEWLNSDKVFHVFRDHDAHYEFPIIGCAFGLKGRLSEELKNIMVHYATTTNYYGNDQVYLLDHVWPVVEDKTFVHSMREGWFGETRKKLKNPLSFCGNGYDENDMPLYASTLAEMSTFKVKPEDKFDEGILL